MNTNEHSISALRGLIKLLDDGDLVRNINNDGDLSAFLAQGFKITKALKAAQDALDSAHADKITASEKAAAVEPLKPTLEDDFDIWWRDEGSGMPPLPGEDAETHVHRVCRIAWSNGAFKATEAA